jgi:predicted transposase YdaD
MLLDLNANYPTFEETPFYQEILRRGLEKGKTENTLLNAERLLREGLADDIILRVTEISVEELADLKRRIAV